jgi:UDP-N-acetylmuramoylalanine--D-glutamate ligase
MLKLNIKNKQHLLVQNRMKSLASFSAIEHRLEVVRTHNDITWINDSKSTDAEATSFSLEKLQGPLIWIAGYNENKRTLELIREQVQQKVVEIICFGQFETELKYYFASSIKYGYKKDLKKAIDLAASNAKSGTSILFSPACPSFLNYDNYKQRGNDFKNLVNKII